MPFSLELRDNELLKVLKRIVGCSVLPLEFGPEGLHIDVGTDAKSSAYSVYFPKEYFGSYDFVGDVPEIYPIGSTNVTNMLKMLDAVTLPIVIESTLDGVLKFTTLDSGKHFRVKRLEGEYKVYMEKIRSKFESIIANRVSIVANVPVLPFKQALKQLKVISENLVLNAKDSEIEISAEGIEMEGNIVVNLNDNITGEWVGKFGAGLLYTGVELFDTVENVLVYLSDTMTFITDKDCLYYRYVTAPQRR